MRAIVSFANERGNYIKALERLGESLKGNTDATFFPFIGEESIGAPNHLDNNYAFKVYAIDKVRKLGYKHILYLDSSVYAIGNLETIFRLIEEDGHAMQDSGHYIGDWCNDRALVHYRLSRTDAKGMLMYGNAGLLGLSFYNRKAYEWFEDWKLGMQNGLFNGDWANHRHDMTIGSILAHRYCMKYNIRGDEILQYASPEEEPINNTIVLKAQGL